MKKYLILINTIAFIFFLTSELVAESLDLCNPFHLPSNKIKIDKIDKNRMNEFMNLVWKKTLQKENSIIANREKKGNCWKLGEWTNSLCFEPIKIYEKLINNEIYIFLLLAADLDSNQQGCWSDNSIDCYIGASRAGSSVIGVFSFKKIDDEFVEPTGYSGVCNIDPSFESNDIKFEQNGANSYLWTIKSFSNGQGSAYTTLFMIPAFDEEKSTPYDVATFSVDYDNFGNIAPFIKQKIDYSFIKSNKEFYDLSLRFKCGKSNKEPVLINDNFELPQLTPYPYPLISNFSYKNHKYLLPESSDKYSDTADVLGWFSKKSKCRI